MLALLPSPALGERRHRGLARGASMCQFGEHGFSVKPLSNLVFALPQASSNCLWVKFVGPLRLGPLKSAPRRLAPLSLA